MKTNLFLMLQFVAIYVSAQRGPLVSSSCGPDNGSFQTYCGVYKPPAVCPLSFYLQSIAGNPPCVPNWTRSHGSPQVFVGSIPADNYAYAWADGGTGEGLFAGYNFVPNTLYRVEIREQVLDNVGTYNIYAANGMVDGTPTSDCGNNAVPTVADKELIVSHNESIVGSWQNRVYSYKPHAAFSQVWVYPTTTAPTRFHFYMDYISICVDCAGTIIYNTGQAPSGTSLAGSIQAGSSAGTGGAGIVTVSSTVLTTFNAGTEINLLPNFQATLSTGTFIAQIVPCTGSRTFTQEDHNIDISRNRQYEGERPYSKNPMADIKIFPVVTTGLVYLSAHERIFDNVALSVVDASGRTVYHSIIHSQSVSHTVNLDKLGNGIYFLQLDAPGIKTTKKIIISK
jgi:hypothetical protein